MADLSMFDRLRREREQQTTNTRPNISMFGYEWQGDAPEPEKFDLRNYQPEPKSATGAFFKAAPAYLKQTYTDYIKKNEENQRNMTFGQKAFDDLVRKPLAIDKFIVQGIIGGLISTGRSVQETILRASPTIDKKRAQEILDRKTDFSRATEKWLTGEEDVQTYSEIIQGVADYLDVSPYATEGEKKYLPITLGIGLIAADLFPGGKPAKKPFQRLVKDLVKASTEKKATSILVKAGIPEDVAKVIAKDIPAAKTADDVAKVIEGSFKKNLENAIGEAAPTAKKLVGRNKPSGPATPTNPLAERSAARAFGEQVQEGAGRTARRSVPQETATITGRELAREFAELGTDGGVSSFTLRQIEAEDYIDDVVAIDDLRQLDPDLNDFLESGTIREFEGPEFAAPPIIDSDGTVIDGYNRIAQALANGQDTIEIRRGVKRADAAEIITDARGDVVGKKSTATKLAENKASRTVEPAGKKVTTLADVDPEMKIEASRLGKEVDPDFEPGAINDMIGRDQVTLRPTRRSGVPKDKGRNRAKEMADNITRFNEKLPTEVMQQARAEALLPPETLLEIVARSRGIITNQMSIDRAKLIKGTIEDVVNLPKGTVATAEQQAAIAQIIQEQRRINESLITMIETGQKGGGAGERRLLKELGEEYTDLTEAEILNLALSESTAMLKKAEIVQLGIASEIGRALQITSKYIEGIDNRLRLLFNRINSNSKLTDFEKQAYIEYVSKMDTSDDKLFLKALEELVRPDFFDKVAEWSVAAKLWNPTTHIVNFGGNAVRQVADFGVKSVTNPLAARADAAGAIVGFKKGLAGALKAFNDEAYAAQIAKIAELGGNVPAIAGKKGVVVRTPFRLLGAADEIFRNMAYQRKLYRDANTIARKEGLKGRQLEARMEELLNAPTNAMLDAATKEGKRMTFQEDLGDFMRGIDDLRNPRKGKTNTSKAIRTFGRSFIPFLKTPTNLFKQSLDLSPIGIIKNADKLKAAYKAGDQEAIGTIVGEAMLGTAIATYIYLKTQEGEVTGGAPRDKSEKDQFYREKKIPYAIKFGDFWYEYKRLDPFATLMGLTTDITTLVKEGGSENLLGDVAHTISQNLTDKTYLSGVSDLLKALDGEAWEQEYSWKSMILGSSLPSIVGHVARSSDPTIREVDTMGQRLVAQIPGLSSRLPAKVNVLGAEVERANKGLWYFFSPIQREEAEIDPITAELMRLDRNLALPGKSFQRTVDGRKVTYKFTPKEYEVYAKAVGLELAGELETLFETKRYKEMDELEQIKEIDRIRDRIQTKYKEDWLKQKREGTISQEQRWANIAAGRDPNDNGGGGAASYFFGE